MAINGDALRKVQMQILSDPGHFDMDTWGDVIKRPRGTFLGYSLGDAPCGTAACIAGWTLLLEGGDPVRYANRRDEDHKPMVHALARDLLGLTDEQADELFYRENWPADLAAMYEVITDPTRLARVASDAIDRFIEKYAMAQDEVTVTQFSCARNGEPSDT